jgi:hypothetical protein
MRRVFVAIVSAAVVGGGAAYLVDSSLSGVVGLVVASGFGIFAAFGCLLALDRVLDLGLKSDFVDAFPGVAARLSMVSEAE